MNSDSPGGAEPSVIGPDEGTPLRMGANEIALKVTSAQGEKFALVEFRVAPRFAAPAVLHHHTREDWAAYVVEGEVTFVFSEREVRASAGATVFVPAGADFTWRNDREEPARYLAIYAPAGFEQFFPDLAGAVAAGGRAPTPEVMRQVIPPLWAKYDIRPRPSSGARPVE
jgi:mannose-6-phosphate isomerase-like protein (cupin superfamily)